jgi:hypothetical protein
VFNGSDDGVTQSELGGRVAQALEDWEGAAGANIAGAGGNGTTGAIAVTNVWGYFRGPRETRQIVEWDMILDDVDYAWSLTGEPGKMDVWNIVEHEVGHALGMGHPETSCTEETMYAYAGTGETKKRTLESGDEAGIAELY